MGVQLIVLNGGSSAGKSTIARQLQGVLTPPWLVLGVDDLAEAVPREGIVDGSLLRFGDGGRVETGPAWRVVEESWYVGIAAMARNGTGVILDEVFLDGARGQDRVRAAVGDLDVLWVGVLCNGRIAAEREARRPDRAPGMAMAQADVVHEGMRYDVVVDTGQATPADCVATITSGLSATRELAGVPRRARKSALGRG